MNNQSSKYDNYALITRSPMDGMGGTRAGRSPMDGMGGTRSGRSPLDMTGGGR